MNEEEKKKLIQDIQLMKMETKSTLEQYRFLVISTGKNYNKEIDKLLDKLNRLKALEKELEKK